MCESASFRRIYPIAQQLVGKLFDAIAQEVEDLVAMDRSKMSLVERGRWSVQVVRLLKTLQKDYPEASESTKEGRQSIKRLKTPEELEEEAASFDALLGLAPRTPPRTSVLEPITEGQTLSPSQSLTQPKPLIGTNERQKTTTVTPIADPSGFPYMGEKSWAIDHNAETAEILRRVRTTAPPPPS